MYVVTEVILYTILGKYFKIKYSKHQVLTKIYESV